MTRNRCHAQLAAALRDAITRLNRRLRQARPMGDLTITQLSALTSLELAGALTPRELADVERVQPPTLTKIVAKLEERGLVQRTPHPTDGRQVILAPPRRAGRSSAEYDGPATSGWPSGSPELDEPGGPRDSSETRRPSILGRLGTWMTRTPERDECRRIDIPVPDRSATTASSRPGS